MWPYTTVSQTGFIGFLTHLVLKSVRTTFNKIAKYKYQIDIVSITKIKPFHYQYINESMRVQNVWKNYQISTRNQNQLVCEKQTDCNDIIFQQIYVCDLSFSIQLSEAWNNHKILK